MKNLFIKLVNQKKSSLLILVIALLLQIITWPFLFLFGVRYHLNEQVMQSFLILSAIWFFIPLLSIGAIIIAVIQIRKRNSLKLPIIGLILNTIWLILFSFIAYLVFVVKISV